MARRKSRTSRVQKRSRTSRVSRRGKRSRSSRVQRRGKRSRTSRISRRGKRARTSRVQKRARTSRVQKRSRVSRKRLNRSKRYRRTKGGAVVVPRVNLDLAEEMISTEDEAEKVKEAVQAFKVRTRHVSDAGADKNWQLAKNLMRALESYYGSNQLVDETDEEGESLRTDYFYQTLSSPQGTRIALKERIREAYGVQPWLFGIIDS